MSRGLGDVYKRQRQHRLPALSRKISSVLLEVIHDLTDGGQLRCLLVLDRDAERILDRHDQLHDVERIRAEIIRDMRLDVFDVLVGINLLREGLDIPEIQLVAILDADKEGFLRSETSLIQTIGRAARNSEGHVIMYADKITDSMRNAIDETERRRRIQQEYNKEHNITPKTIQKSVRCLLYTSPSPRDTR